MKRLILLVVCTILGSLEVRAAVQAPATADPVPAAYQTCQSNPANCQPLFDLCTNKYNSEACTDSAQIILAGAASITTTLQNLCTTANGLRQNTPEKEFPLSQCNTSATACLASKNNLSSDCITWALTTALGWDYLFSIDSTYQSCTSNNSCFAFLDKFTSLAPNTTARDLNYLCQKSGSATSAACNTWGDLLGDNLTGTTAYALYIQQLGFNDDYNLCNQNNATGCSNLITNFLQTNGAVVAETLNNLCQKGITAACTAFNTILNSNPPANVAMLVPQILLSNALGACGQNNQANCQTLVAQFWTPNLPNINTSAPALLALTEVAGGLANLCQQNPGTAACSTLGTLYAANNATLPTNFFENACNNSTKNGSICANLASLTPAQ